MRSAGTAKFRLWPSSACKRRDADHLSEHIHDRRAGRAGRDRRGDLNDAAVAGDLSHCGDDAVRNASLKPERIADDDDRFAFLRHAADDLQGLRGRLWRVDLQQRKIAFAIDGEHAAHREFACRPS